MLCPNRGPLQVSHRGGIAGNGRLTLTGSAGNSRTTATAGCCCAVRRSCSAWAKRSTCSPSRRDAPPSSGRRSGTACCGRLSGDCDFLLKKPPVNGCFSVIESRGGPWFRTPCPRSISTGSSSASGRAPTPREQPVPGLFVCYDRSQIEPPEPPWDPGSLDTGYDDSSPAQSDISFVSLLLSDQNYTREISPLWIAFALYCYSHSIFCWGGCICTAH